MVQMKNHFPLQETKEEDKPKRKLPDPEKFNKKQAPPTTNAGTGSNHLAAVTTGGGAKNSDKEDALSEVNGGHMPPIQASSGQANVTR